ncbi:MAG: histidine triad nucleotide-binding protein [Vicinamibacterales bacterium]
MDACVFCRIAAGQAPASVVYEDEEMIAIRDVNPQAPLHLLVIPRKHVRTLNDLAEGDDLLIGRMIRRAAALAAENGAAAQGYRTVFNCERGAGQTVYHIHLHVLGGRHFGWPPG